MSECKNCDRQSDSVYLIRGEGYYCPECAITKLRAQLTALQAAKDFAEHELKNILAVTHRDGGHHTGKVGLSQSVEDAHKVWAELQSAKEAAEMAEKITGETSDGYHTFNELYDYRKVYNALLFNEWAASGKYGVHKSWKHSDGELCFGGGWFIVVAQLPTGQVSNHYKTEDWNLFQVEERPIPYTYDGHTPQIALARLKELSTNSVKEGAQPQLTKHIEK